MTRASQGAARLFLIVLLALGGCDRAGRIGLARTISAEAPAPPAFTLPAKANVAQAVKANSALPRLIALRHELEIVTAPEAVEGAWRAANQACADAGCDVIGSTLIRNDARHPTKATLEARVPRATFAAFLAKTTSLGAVGRHEISAEDKTDEVIDVEARLKNLSEFRDRLRSMLATPGAKLTDLVDVERELVRVQSELDSLNTRRKVLAGETERVHVVLEFRARATVLETGAWAPVTDALSGAGRMLASSIGAAISFVIAALPWLLLLWGAVAAVRALWRRRRSA
jgi:hypothetical protein